MWCEVISVGQDRKMNNPSWCCEKIEELLQEYKNKQEDSHDSAEYETYKEVIEDIEKILYE